jgi:hypothetical protein
MQRPRSGSPTYISLDAMRACCALRRLSPLAQRVPAAGSTTREVEVGGEQMRRELIRLAQEPRQNRKIEQAAMR